MLIAWVLFPLVLAVLALGCGLLLERVASTPLPGALVLPAGLAVIVVVAQLAILTDATAELAVPLVVALAVAGIAIGKPWRSLRVDPWALGAAVLVFALFAAPVVLSGQATWAGYLRVDDTAQWFALTDRAMAHGRSVDGLPFSTYGGVLELYIRHGYPLGAFLPLGVGRSLVGQDVAWLFQPYVAFLGAMLALSLYSLAGRLTQVGWQRALCAVVAAQAALLFGWSLIGGVKEVASAGLIVLAAALLPQALDDRRQLGVLPLAMAVAAGLSVMSFGGMIWLLPILLGALVMLFMQSGPEVALRRTAWFAGIALLLCLPALPGAIKFLSDASGNLTEQGSSIGARGLLFHPLNLLQVLGIWPVGDFRLVPGNEAATYFLIAVAIAAAAIGMVWALRRSVLEPVIYVWAAALALIVIAIPGSPWVDGKALAIASPAFLFAAMIGVLALFGTGRRFEATLVAVAIAGGVVWSNALAYNSVYVAPRDRMAELKDIGNQIAGEGPTLVADGLLYGNNHFLRDAVPQPILPENFRPEVAKAGAGVPLHAIGRVIDDVDNYRIAQLLRYRTLVLPSSPAASRPPSVFKLTHKGRYYQVWQQPKRSRSQIIEHLSLPTDPSAPQAGSGRPPGVPAGLQQPADRVRCSEVRRLARVAGPNGRLAAVERPLTSMFPLSRFAHPSSWTNSPVDVYPTGDGTASREVRLQNLGAPYDVYVNGTLVELRVDGKTLGKTGYEPMRSNDYERLGQVQPGRHRFEVRYGDKSALHPGGGGEPRPLGPILLGSGTADRPVIYLPTARARELCGKTLDWVEALGS